MVGVVPTIGFRMSNRRFYQGDYEGARHLMSALRWLHPIQDWPMQEAFYRAFQSVSQGNPGEAKGILANLKSKNPRAFSDKEWRIFYLMRDWDGLIDWWRRYPNKAKVEKNAEIVAQYLRALGEIGDLNAMLHQFEQYKRTLERTPNLYHFSFLYIFALCGRIELTKQIMDSGVLEGLDSDMRVIWLATAECAFGNRETGRELVKPLLETKDHMVRIPAQKCASGLIALASEKLTPESLQILSRIEQEWSITDQLAKRGS